MKWPWVRKPQRAGLPRVLWMDHDEKLAFRLVHAGDWFRDGFHSLGWLVYTESPRALITTEDESKRLMSLTDAVELITAKHREYARRNEA